MREALSPDQRKRGKRVNKSVVDQEGEPSPPNKAIRVNIEDMEFKVFVHL